MVDGIFGSRTEAAVRAFQEIFGLTPDGIVGPGTWNEIVRLYTAVTDLAELRSQGQQFYAIEWSPPGGLQEGSTGERVRQLQYMLSILSNYIPSIPPVRVDGIYGPATRSAVLAAQRRFRLPETGRIDELTWDLIYDQYSGIENTTLRSGENFPGRGAPGGTSGTRTVTAGNFPNRSRTQRPSTPQTIGYNRTTTMRQFPGMDLSAGAQDPVSQEVVR